MRTVEIQTMQNSYPIYIGENILKKAKDHISGKAIIVTDENVNELHIEKLKKAIGDHKVIVLPAGEQTKSEKQLFHLYDEFAKFGINRKDTIIGFGGGVIGDLTGYAAGSFMRGVNYIAVPTTLLSMVDSSVGGKVAINHPAGKNLIGMFYQPSAVVADTSLLSTLDDRQIACGMAEIIKYGAIADEQLFEKLNQKIDINELVERCVLIKQDFVKNDTFDKGIRMMLNFGHTIGHCVENGCGYGKILHGEAVAIGMVKESEIGEKLGITEIGTAKKIQTLCEKHNLSTKLPPIDNIAEIIAHDKKNENENIQLALIEKIGKDKLTLMSIEKLKELL